MILYLDCDGVILNTIEACYKLMQEQKLDYTNSDLVHEYFVNVDWNYLIYKGGILKESILKIKKIIESNYFKDVIILTKLCGNLEEEKDKRILFSKLLPNTKVITVPWEKDKDEIVNPCGNILVDDSHSNIKKWVSKGGIGIYFVKENPSYEKDEISDLDSLMKVKCLKRN